MLTPRIAVSRLLRRACALGVVVTFAACGDSTDSQEGISPAEPTLATTTSVDCSGTDEETGSVELTVTDADGTPVSGVSTLVWSPECGHRPENDGGLVLTGSDGVAIHDNRIAGLEYCAVVKPNDLEEPAVWADPTSALTSTPQFGAVVSTHRTGKAESLTTESFEFNCGDGVHIPVKAGKTTRVRMDVDAGDAVDINVRSADGSGSDVPAYLIIPVETSFFFSATGIPVASHMHGGIGLTRSSAPGGTSQGRVPSGSRWTLEVLDRFEDDQKLDGGAAEAFPTLCHGEGTGAGSFECVMEPAFCQIELTEEFDEGLDSEFLPVPDRGVKSGFQLDPSFLESTTDELKPTSVVGFRFHWRGTGSFTIKMHTAEGSTENMQIDVDVTEPGSCTIRKLAGNLANDGETAAVACAARSTDPNESESVVTTWATVPDGTTAIEWKAETSGDVLNDPERSGGARILVQKTDTCVDTTNDPDFIVM